MKRPILPILICYILGILAYEYLLFNLSFFIFCIVILCLFYSIDKKKSILYFFIFCFSIFLIHIRIPILSLQNQEFFEGKIYQKKETKTGFNYYLRLKDININVEMYSEENFFEGNIIKIFGTIDTPSARNNFKTFNKTKYLKSKNIFFTIKPKHIDLIKNNMDLKYKIRSHISDFYEKNLNTQSYQFVNSMILGQQGDGDLFDTFQELGLSHILAVSGLHLNIIIKFLDKLGNKLKLKKKSYNIFIILLLIFYGYIIDFPISLIRALVMYIISTMAIYTNNIKDEFNSIFVSMLITLIINPFCIYSTAFYLSYCAIISIIYFSKNIKNIFKKIPDIFISTLSIQIGMFPILIYFFNSLNLLSLLVNAIIIPLISLVLTSAIGFLFIRIDALKFFIEGIFFIISKIIYPFHQISEIFRVEFPSWNFSEILIFYLIFYLIFNYRIIIYKINRNKKILYILLLPILILLKSVLLPTVLINIIDIGQGDSILLRSNNKKVLVDTGGNALTPEYSGKQFYDYLIKNGVRRINHLFITHSDIDHVGNLDYIIDKIKIDNLYANDDINYKTKNIPKNLKFKIENLNFTTILNGEDGKTPNDKSLVFLVEIFGKNLLLTGDIENGEEKIKIDGIIDFLKVAHHGSKHSTRDEFLENNIIINALISAGRNNNYGHPSNDTIERLTNEKAKIYRTDLQGNIEISINPLFYYIDFYNKRYDVFEFIFYKILI